MISAERLVWWTDKLLPLFPLDVLKEMQAQPQIVQQVVNATHEYWMIHDDEILVGLFGVVNGSLISQTAYIWFIPFKTYRTRHALRGRKLFEEWASEYRTVTAQCFNERSARFAALFGFVEIEPGIFERKS